MIARLFLLTNPDIMKKFLLGFLVFAMAMPFASAQHKEVSGKITASADGQPIVGATVQDKASGQFAISDDKGVYHVFVSEKSTELTVMCLGYKDKIVQISGNVINVALDTDALSIDETMVIAYGQGKKSTFTGSASVVKKEELQRVSSSNISQSLQGLSSGVQVINSSGQPGDSGTIMIRGIGSMNASSSPLWVVDGVPYSGYINAIAPTDIESMTVLKDASATSLYGSRAANGVIIVTTRSGRSEEGKISFKSSIGFSSLAVDLPAELTPAQFSEATWMAIYNEQRYIKNMDAADAAAYATANTATEMKINPWSSSTPVGLDGKVAPDAKLLWSGAWRDETMKSRPRQEYNVDFSGKKGSTSYFFSGGYLNDKGIYTTQQFERITGRANVSTKVKNWFEFGTNTSFAHSLTDAPAGSDVVWMLRTIPSIYSIYLRDASGNLILDGNGDKIYDYGNDRVGWSGWNVLGDAKYNTYKTYVDNISNRDYIEVTFMPTLKFRSTLSIDYYLTSYHGYTNADYGYMAGRGSAYKSYDRNVATTLTNVLNYNQSFGKHTVGITLGEENFSRHVTGMSGGKEDFPFSGLTELSSAATMTSLSSYIDDYRLLSFFSRAEYDFDNKYYISASLRTDGSSKFSPSSRWGTFWSVGASWRINKENWLADVSWLDNLKLRASYGAVGNDGLSSWYCYQGLYASGYNNNGKAGVLISRLPNETLKWETNLQANVGLDFSIFNRLSGALEVYNRSSKDLLFTMPMAPSTGFSGIDRNIGNVRNYGVELQLNWIVMDRDNFRWNMDFNLTHYENRITKLPQKEMNAGYFKWREGQSRYNYWGAEFAGVNPENGMPQYWKNVYELDENGEKQIVDRVITENVSDVTSDDQKQYLGDAIPDLFGSWTNTFNFYGVDLSFMWYYSLGGMMCDNDYWQSMIYRQGYSYHPDVFNTWSETNKDASLPLFYRGQQSTFSSQYLYKNSFLRLRNVTLGYTLPKKALNKMHFDQLRIYAQIDNYLTFGSAAKRGTDPEQSVSGGTGNRFPATKSVTFGLQFTF